MNMSILPLATAASKTKNKSVQQIALFYAAIIVVMVVAQLFTFDTFVLLVKEFNFPGGVRSADFLSALVVIAEVFALPFLLRMPLSKAFRWVSMVSGWLVAGLWLYVSLRLVLQASSVHNVGFLGTVVAITPGWWAILLSVVLGVLATWASWGLWPMKRSAQHKK